MRRAFIATLLLGAAIGLSPPAQADTWSGSLTGTGVFIAPTSAQTSTLVPATTAAIPYNYRSDGSPTWSICNSPWGYSTTAFDAPCQAFRDGATFGGTYRAPTGLGATGWLSVDWFSATDGQNTSIDDRDIGRTYLTSDRSFLYQTLTRTLGGNNESVHVDLRPFHGLIWYSPSEPGTGVTTDFAGGSVFLGFFGYAASGQDEWRIATGSMTTPSTGSFAFQRCTKLSETAVSCTSEGTVSIQTRLVSSMGGAVQTPYLDVTYPNGVLKTYQRYAF